MRISDWSSDVCSSDLIEDLVAQTEYTNQGIALYQSAIAAVEQHKSREPWYQAALSFIPSIRSKRIIQHLHAISDELIRQEVQKNIHNPEKRSEEHTSELQSLMRLPYTLFCLQK